ncbi:UNVERIFIED_CONTAM: ABC transporter G family member 27 [Sesamum angustifolium]|uniref:ABC transporter G family member 27 n=1 Tax=Sesamum angustifolium TaxID=2727405 RepID=A0AAW2MS42_9LAMI
MLSKERAADMVKNERWFLLPHHSDSFSLHYSSSGSGLAIGATLMDLKKATTLASVTVMTFMLAGILCEVFISWLRYLSFNYHTYKLLLKVQYEHISHSINGVRIDSGYKEVGVLAAMVVGYRLLAYLSLRRMKLHPGA